MGSFDHLRHSQTRRGRDWMAPEIREAPGVYLVDLKAAGKLVRLGAALSAPLNSAVAADGHDAALLAPQHSAGQGEVDYGLDVFHAEFVLG